MERVVDKGEKYIKTVKDRSGNTVEIDVYDVLVAFNVTCPAMAHALKKLLCAGDRGHKDFFDDTNEAINSIRRSQHLHDD